MITATLILILSSGQTSTIQNIASVELCEATQRELKEQLGVRLIASSCTAQLPDSATLRVR